jgi:hypothetical protein
MASFLSHFVRLRLVLVEKSPSYQLRFPLGWRRLHVEVIFFAAHEGPLRDRAWVTGNPEVIGSSVGLVTTNALGVIDD